MAQQFTIDHNVAERGATQINNFSVSTSYSTEETTRLCLRALRCPNPFAIKTRLREKDKLLHQCFNWIFQDPQYVRWQDGEDVCLLWIKGGAGKGKTMMSIGLIEALLQRPRSETTVTYFFCQNADYELNSIEAIIKGLIYQLLQQQESVAKALRNRWDTANQRYIEDVTSWRALWTIFGEMLEQCQTPRVYVVMDALDECQGDGMADLLRLIVRTGLGQPSRIKWLLTSRPLDSAERELLVGSEQVRVDLELNTQYVAQGIRFYTSYKVAELGRRRGAGLVQQHVIKEELRQKGEDTFLWVSHVCKSLENVDKDDMFSTIQTLPPDLDRFYHGMLIQLCESDTRITNGCIRLLKVMMLVHRPLDVREVSSVTGLLDDRQYIEAVIGRGAAFLKLRGTVVEFVHQSARDYLARAESHHLLNSRDQYGQREIALNCCDHLIQHLKVNILNLPQWDATRDLIQDGGSDLFVSLGYAAAFWFQHLNDARDHHPTHTVPTHDGRAEKLLRSHFLEWLECLSLMDQLPRAIEGLDIILGMTSYTAQSDSQPSLSDLVQDSRRFLSRHFSTVSTWPLQAYHCAIIFSPTQSLVRQAYVDSVPAWLKKLPVVEKYWASLLQTLIGHSHEILSVKFSPDGQFILSGSCDDTIKLWNTKTGTVFQTLDSPSYTIAMAISPDGRFIASAHNNSIIRLWDMKTKLVTRKLVDRDSKDIAAIEFSPDGHTIASESGDGIIKLWDMKTGAMIRTLVADQSSYRDYAIAFSPDGRLISSGSRVGIVKIWNIKTGTVIRTLNGHSDSTLAMKFSPDGQTIVSGSSNNTIKIWNIREGSVSQTLTEHSSEVRAIAFSPDGQTIISGSKDGSIKLWNAETGTLIRTLTGHSGMVMDMAFSPDGRTIVSGDSDGSIKLWDIRAEVVEQPLPGHSKLIMDLEFSPDSLYLVSASTDETIKIWDIQRGLVLRTLVNRSGSLYSMAISPDGQSVASGSTLAIEIWDVETGVVIRRLTTVYPNMAVAFSPDGHFIASGLANNTVKIWNLKTMVEVVTLTDYSDTVQALTFSPDGQYIASASGSLITVWKMEEIMYAPRRPGKIFRDRKKSRAIPQEVNMSERVWRLRFSADSRWLLANYGAFRVEMASLKKQYQEAWSPHDLSVQSKWICCGSRRVIRLPGDDLISCYDVKEGQLAIGLLNGRLWTFTIDRESLVQSLSDGMKIGRSL